MPRRPTPLQAIRRRETLKEELRIAGRLLAKSIFRRLEAGGLADDLDFLRDVFRGHVQLALSFPIVPGKDFGREIAEFMASGDHEAAYMLHTQQILIEGMPPGPLSEFDEETAWTCLDAGLGRALEESAPLPC